MAHEWLFVGLFLIIAIGFAIIPLVVARLVAPRKPHALKHQTYECGMETVGDTWVQFKAQYYIFALIFVIFDVEIVFLFPWAVAYQQLPFFAVVEGVLFILILAGGLVYVWRKGVLDWV